MTTISASVAMPTPHPHQNPLMCGAFSIVGCPSQEIHDEYIQEILDGFDVDSAVLAPKDDEYLKFRDHIKEKSQIRQHLSNASDAVIQQVERWWDKYGVSLARIDTEAKEAEAVMHGFLRELGYE